MICDNVGGIRDPFKQDLALEFCRKKNKGISILTETHIDHDQIHHIRNNWLYPIFCSPGDSHTTGLLVPKVSLRLTLIQKGSLCFLRLLPLMTEFSVLIPLQGIAPQSSWLGGVSLKDYKIMWKIEMREMKTK